MRPWPGARQAQPETTFIWWAALLGAALQGFWVVTSVYLVIEAELSATQLLLLGTALELSVLVAEVPTGVVADTVSRKWSMVISMLVMGSAFVVAGMTASFGGLVVVNVAWGVGWTFTSGADVAWLADELGHRGADQRSIDGAITRRARWQQRGGAAGLVGFGMLGWLTSPATSMMVPAALSWVWRSGSPPCSQKTGSARAATIGWSGRPGSCEPAWRWCVPIGSSSDCW